MRNILVILAILSAALVYGIAEKKGLIANVSDPEPGPTEVGRKAAANCLPVLERSKAYLGKAKSLGVILDYRVNQAGVMVVVADDFIWSQRPIATREAVALAAWCLVAQENGGGSAAVVGRKSGDMIVIVRDGQVTFLS